MDYNFKKLKSDFEQQLIERGYLSLQLSALLVSNPDLIEKLSSELYIRIEDATLDQLLLKYRKTYYTKQCFAYHDADTCARGAIENNHDDILKMYIAKLEGPVPQDTLEYAATYGNMIILKYAVDNWEIDTGMLIRMFDGVLMRGQMEGFLFLYSRFPDPPVSHEDMVYNALYSTNLELFKHVYGLFPRANLDEEIIREAYVTAAKNNALDMMMYIDQNFSDRLLVEYVNDVDYEDGIDVEISQYDEALITASDEGSFDAVKYICETFPEKLNIKAINRAIRETSNDKNPFIDIVLYLIENMGGNPAYAVGITFSSENTDMLEYLIQKGAVFNTKHLCNAISNGGLTTARYMQDQLGIRLEEEDIYKAYDNAFCRKNFEMMNFLFETYVLPEDKVPKLVAMSACWDVKVFEFCLEKFNYTNYEHVVSKYVKARVYTLFNVEESFDYMLKNQLISVERVLQIYFSNITKENQWLLEFLVERGYVKNIKPYLYFIVKNFRARKVKNMIDETGFDDFNRMLDEIFNQDNGKLVKLVLKYHTSVSVIDLMNRAVKKGKKNVFKSLMKLVDIEEVFVNQCSSLEHIRLIKYIQKRMNVGIDTAFFHTGLQNIVDGKKNMTKRAEILSYFIDKDIVQERYLIEMAIFSDALKIIRELDDKLHFDPNEWLPLAARHGSIKVAKYLMKKSLPETIQMSINEAARNGHVKTVTMLSNA